MRNLFDVFHSGNFIGEVWATDECDAIKFYGGNVASPDWTTKALTAF